MTVKVDPSGRRSLQIEFEVPGTPEQVWQAIATGPGISSWFVPTEIEEENGKPVAIKLNFGPGMEPKSKITAYNPPKMYSTVAEGWMPGSPAIANEWSVEARAGGVCVVRIVQSLFASTDDWDAQLEAAKGGLASFLEVLRVYLTHFGGQSSSTMKWMVPASGTDADAWKALLTALGISGELSLGQRVTTSGDVPQFSGVVEYLTEHPFDALLRLDPPNSGIAALGTTTFPGGPTMMAMNFYFYGGDCAATAARETPQWEAWFQKHYPMPSDAGIPD